MAPWQPREVAEEREGAHGLPPCFSGLAGLAHPSTRGDWKSLVTESFLVSCAPGQEPGSYHLWCHFGCPFSGATGATEQCLAVSSLKPFVYQYAMAQADLCSHCLLLWGLFSWLRLGACLLVNCLSYLLFSVLYSLLVLLGYFLPSLTFSLELQMSLSGLCSVVPTDLALGLPVQGSRRMAPSPVLLAPSHPQQLQPHGTCPL